MSFERTLEQPTPKRNKVVHVFVIILFPNGAGWLQPCGSIRKSFGFKPWFQTYLTARQANRASVFSKVA